MPNPVAGEAPSNPLAPATRGILPLWVKWIIAVLTISLVIGLGYSTVYRAGPHQFGERTWGSTAHRTDFTVYQLAGRAILDGADIYQVRNSNGWAYVYPPPFAVAMVPFAAMSVFWGTMVWSLISLTLVAWAVVMCVRMVRSTDAGDVDPFTLATVPVLLLIVFLMSGLTRGQASIHLFWLVVAAIYWQRKGRNLLGGICLAGATLVKAYPVALLAYFVWRKQWRFVAATLAAILVGALLLPLPVLGWQKTMHYWQEWVQVVAFPSVSTESGRAENPLTEQLLSWEKPRNQSLPAVLWRVSGSNATRPLAAAIGLAMIAAIWAVGRRTRPESEVLIVSAVLVWLLLIPPISESHYFALLLLPLTALTATALREPDKKSRRLAGIVLIAFAVIGLAAEGFIVAESTAEVIRWLHVAGQLCWLSLLVWSALLLTATRRSKMVIAASGAGTDSDRSNMDTTRKQTDADAASPIVEKSQPRADKVPTGISLVLPMYNESPGVDVTLREAVNILGRDFSDFEIVVADDKSTDDSAEKVERWTAKDPRIRLVRLEFNKRFGGALRAGLKAASKEYLFYTDFDLQVGLSCLPQMLNELSDADIITGYSAHQVKHANWRSTVISWGYNFLVRTMFGLQLRDINFGFKAMRKSLYDQMALRSRSPFVDAEMFVQALQLGCTIKEVPVPFTMRQVGVSHIRRPYVIAWTFLDMLRLRIRRSRKWRETQLTDAAVTPQSHEAVGHQRR